MITTLGDRTPKALFHGYLPLVYDPIDTLSVVRRLHFVGSCGACNGPTKDRYVMMITVS